jgi:hypothetical protein
VTFKRFEAAELSAHQELAQKQQEYASCEKRELVFLAKLNLAQAQAYSNYKDSIKSKDQTKIHLTTLQMKETFGDSLENRYLFILGQKIVKHLIMLESAIYWSEVNLRLLSQEKQEYLRNYPK